MEVASRKKHLKEAADTTQLESTMSFRQIWADLSCPARDMSEQEEDGRRLWLAAIANTDNPFSLLQVIRRGHEIAKS